MPTSWRWPGRRGSACSRVPRAALTSLAGTTHHQGVVARVAPREYAELEDLLAVPGTRGEPALFLALDQVQDPGNVGNLLRTAEALGVHGVLVPRHQAAGLTPHVVRAAAGALEYLLGGPGREPRPGARAPEAGGVLDRRSRGRGRGSRDGPGPLGGGSPGGRWSWSWGARGGVSGRWWPGPATCWSGFPWPGGWGRSTWRPRGRPSCTRSGDSGGRGPGPGRGAAGKNWVDT